MDELSLLVADSTEAVEAAESANISLPAPDFTGSLDFIDSLPSRSALAIRPRDVAGITTAVSSFDYLSPLFDNKAVRPASDDAFNVSTDFRPLGDARRFDPEFSVRPPRALVRSAAQVVAARVPAPLRADFPPGWRNPLDPERSTEDLNRAIREAERRLLRKPFSFRRPNQVVICLKRRIRRQIMHSMGFAGRHYFPRRFSYWSKVVC